MNPKETWMETSGSENEILALASLFDGEFSIDWVLELSKAKATSVLTIFENACQKEMLKKIDLGIFNFTNQKIKDRMKSTIPKTERELLHRKIARLMINEAPDNEQAVMTAASQLTHVLNDLEGCGILLEAGDRYRKKGSSKKALECYGKAIEDLKGKTGRQEDILFVKAIIGYSKDRLSLSTPEATIKLLKQALERVETHTDTSLKAIIYLHLASVEYVQMKYISAQKYFSKGRKLAQNTNDPVVEHTLNTISVVHYCYSGRFKDAVKKYESIESIFSRKNSDYRLSLKVGIILGISYAHTGQISQGLGMLNQLREDALLLNDHDAAARASVYISFALILKNDLENAAMQIHETLKDSKRLDLFTKSLANLMQAHIYFEKNDYEKSHEYLQEALKTRNKYSFTLRGHLFEFCLAMIKGDYPPVKGLSLEDEIRMSIDIGNVHNQGIAYRYKAMLQHDNNEPHENVLESLKQALHFIKKSGSQFDLAKTYEALGRYYIDRNNTVKAKKYIEAAEKILLEHGGRHVESDLKHLLKDTHIKEGLVEEILNIGPEVVKIRDIKKVSQRILLAVIKITEAERGGIFLYSGESGGGVQEIKLLEGKNLSDEDIKKPDFHLSSQMILESAGTGLGKLENIDKTISSKNDAIKSRICVPLMQGEKAIGVLYFDNRLFRSPFKKQDLKILSYFASLAAISLDNAQAYEKIQSLNQRLYEEKNYLEEQQLEHLHFEDFVAASPEIKNVLTLVERVADTEATVLILGDTGVGKEMVARAIHQQSSRKNKPFIRVNCSAFPESLIASELFGHEKGSFTGAEKRRIGRFELADTGTLFLDEIGDISMDIQVRLLRVLQTKKFERVGASESIESDFRLLTATNRDLKKAVAEGRFRQDLFYRLNVFPIYVPPLKDRMEDISPLACHFLKKHADKMKKLFKGIPEKEMDKLLSYHWPGNVRELENVIERGVILNSDDLFSVPELSLDTGGTAIAEQLTLEELERRYIFDTLRKCDWKIYGPEGAAIKLGLKNSTLYSRMKKLGIRNPNKKQDTSK